MKKKDYALRLDQRLKKLEEIIDSLLESLDFAELTTVERLMLVSRFESLHQRGLAIGHTLQQTEPGNRENALTAAFRRYVRGDTDVLSDLEDTGVVDGEFESMEVAALVPGLDVDDLEID